MQTKARTAAAVLFTLIIGAADIRYCRLILRELVHPSLATWLLFEVAVVLCIATYLSGKKRNLVDNINNAVDVAMVSMILAAMIVHNGWKGIHFSPLEKCCFAASALILVFWAASKNHDAANLCTQCILVVGYFPTFANLWKATRNPESFVTWGAVILGSVVSLYPAIWGEKGKNRLAIVYATRAIVMTLVVLLLMLRVELGFTL